MVKIVIENLRKKELGVNNDAKSVLSHLQDHFIDWMHACGAKGRCTTCKMVVISGKDRLTALTPSEVKYRNTKELGSDERLACQAKLLGNISIKVPESSKLPHVEYSD
ncbi:MAG TPA: 2Fe-2S iron-sulfur cluster-binding protein [Cyclobacteriaceae bacterium]